MNAKGGHFQAWLQFDFWCLTRELEIPCCQFQLKPGAGPGQIDERPFLTFHGLWSAAGFKGLIVGCRVVPGRWTLRGITAWGLDAPYPQLHRTSNAWLCMGQVLE